MTGRPLRLLILEDNAEDAELALHKLRQAGFDPTWHRVDDEASFKAHLDPELDLVLADYHQPQFDAIRALKLMREARLDIPVVIVSGAIGEDRAVAAVRLGAADYVLKDRMARLGTVVQNALEQSQLRSQQRQAHQALEHQALHDGLTDLPNRVQLEKLLEVAIVTRPRVALLLLDIDNFKEINDTFGHLLGNAVLRQVGPRLRDQLEPGDVIGRLGGDEFGVVLPGADIDRAISVAHALLRVDRPFVADGHALDLMASIGIAVSPEHGTNSETLLQCAEVAMYAAKRSGNSCAVYRKEDDPYDPSRLVLRADLRRAIAQREIVLFYQPQVALATGQIVGVEALARWKHAARGWIPPAEFIPVAERMGLIKPLTAAVIEMAARQCRAWEEAGRSLTVSVNVSMRNLLDPEFPQSTQGTVATAAADPRRLKFEITESAIMAEPGRVLETMNQLRELGIGFSIDDFGTGYSSLGYLQRLPVEEIKIDRSFVGQLARSAGSTAIVQATIEVARSLHMDVVAEGVEHQATWTALQQMGCFAAQGYLVSKPLPVADLERWLSDWPDKSARLNAA
jgi:diguanylate cyclase (GGDEF)-like protein